VAVAARRSERLEEAFGATSAVQVPADATDVAEVAAMVATANEALGGFDLVLYAAGGGTLAPLVSTDPESWAHDHQVNVIGANLVCAAALEHLAPDGVTAFVSSRGPLDNHWGLASYASSKAALDTAVEGWRVEHPDRRFLRIVMGNTMPTEFAADFAPDIAGVAVARWLAQGIPLDVMEVGDVAELLVELFGIILAHPGIDIPDVRLDARRPAWS
jgi:NAD(P)-dependent dehydrogenase (short-subunit alcohol dehydrogenase family)